MPRTKVKPSFGRFEISYFKIYLGFGFWDLGFPPLAAVWDLGFAGLAVASAMKPSTCPS
jgi:hypothetical protein